MKSKGTKKRNQAKINYVPCECVHAFYPEKRPALTEQKKSKREKQGERERERESERARKREEERELNIIYLKIKKGRQPEFNLHETKCNGDDSHLACVWLQKTHDQRVRKRWRAKTPNHFGRNAFSCVSVEISSATNDCAPASVCVCA